MKEVYGVQIYGAMRLFRQDSRGFLRRLSQAGYTQVEPCVAFGMTAEELEKRGMNPVWLPEEVPGFRAMAGEEGLAITSCHVFGSPRAYGEEMGAMAAENGITALVMGGAPGEGEDAKAYARQCTEFARLLQKYQISLWLHNSFSEIQAREDGVTQYEAVLQACGGLVGAQPDVGWVLYGGEAVGPFLQRIRPFLRSIHYKDIRGDYRECTPAEHPICLGKGKLEIEPVRSLALKLGLPQVVDQDSSDGDFLKDLEESLRAIRQ